MNDIRYFEHCYYVLLLDIVLFLTLHFFHSVEREIHFVPKQLVPSPVKPGLHAHVKLPGMLVQTAFESQLSVPKVHSSSSSIGNKEG